MNRGRNPGLSPCLQPGREGAHPRHAALGRGHLQLWNVRTRTLLGRTLRARGGFSPAPPSARTGAPSPRRTATGTCASGTRGHGRSSAGRCAPARAPSPGVAFSHDGRERGHRERRAGEGDQPGRLGRHARTGGAPGASPTDTAFSLDGRRVVVASDDGTARIWGTNSGRSLHALSGPIDLGRGAASSPGGKTHRHRRRRWDSADLVVPRLRRPAPATTRPGASAPRLDREGARPPAPAQSGRPAGCL